MVNVLKKVFSMSLMTLFLFAFFVAIGRATFIENDFGRHVAQKLVYQAWWFEMIIGYLTLSVLFNIYRYKLLQWKKIGSLMFHLSFVVIIIGAWVTRVTGFEGAMMIREDGSTNIIISYDTFLQMKIHDFDQQYVYNMPVILDKSTNNDFDYTFDFPGEVDPITISFVGMKEGVKDTLIPTGKSSGDPYLEIVTVGQNGRQYNYLKSGDILNGQGLLMSFNNDSLTEAISIFETDSGLFIKSPYDLNYMRMADQSQGMIVRDSIQPFGLKQLYEFMGVNFVSSNYYPSARLERVESAIGNKEMKEVMVAVTQGGQTTQVPLIGGKGQYPEWNRFKFGNLNYELAFGSRLIQLPFYIYLNDFELKRYPGTDKPSSFSSYVTLVDPAKNLEQEHHIFMNNVLDYGGYRFFQSSYDPDEKGTVLSVNHDATGTLITYIGYTFLALGFILNLFASGGRFRHLVKKATEIRKKRESMATLLILGLGLMFSNPTHAQDQKAGDNEVFQGADTSLVVDFEHAEEFSKLVVQSYSGRFQPVHTLAEDLLHKISRQDKYKGQTAMQVFLGLHTNGLAWNMEPLIYVSGKPLRDKLNLGEEKYASLVDFYTLDFQYIILDDVEAARLKRDADRSQYDKDVLKTDERISILSGVMTGMYLSIFPLPNDPAENWYSPYEDNLPFEQKDAAFVNDIMQLYRVAVNKGFQTGDWSEANRIVGVISSFQRKFGNAETIPTDSQVDLEITYNKANIFKHLMRAYLAVGFILLILQFVQVLKPRFKFRTVFNIGYAVFIVLFLLHGIGLGVRWYLSGHAPWSDGYEATVFIGFVAALCGVLFYKRFPIIVPVAGIMAWLLLFVAHLSVMDPQMTDLVPVLKSYWLKIHVAVITGSYAFLGIGAILGLVNMIFYFFANNENEKRVRMTTKELTYLAEIVIIIGLFMLTIGTFLGGVWANESWGRYWGWDPKETWALASVLVYAILLHLRFIPFLKSEFAFNVGALWGYSSIIMTFFGVNYYLSGLHSYAQGDPVPVPMWVKVGIVILILLSVSSGIFYQRRRNQSKQAKK